MKTTTTLLSFAIRPRAALVPCLSLWLAAWCAGPAPIDRDACAGATRGEQCEYVGSPATRPAGA